jgi:hypothetical protein
MPPHYNTLSHKRYYDQPSDSQPVFIIALDMIAVQLIRRELGKEKKEKKENRHPQRIT